MVKRFFKKLLIFCIPFVLLIAFFFAFEPYDYWTLKDDEWYMSRSLSSMRELLLTDPENIILGSSQMANLNVDYIEQISGERYTSLAYGGATLNETIQRFWYATEHTTKLKKVVLGVNFYLMNDFLYSERMDAVIDKAENPLKFMGDFGYWVDAFQNAKNKATNLWADITGNEDARIWLDNPASPDQIDPPTETAVKEGYRADLYDYANIIFGNTAKYNAIGEYVKRVIEIAEYCNANDIELIIALAPSNKSLWELVIFPRLIDVAIDYYKNQLKSVATVYDGEFYNDYAKNDDNFLDGMHLVKAEKLHMARIIFGGEYSEYFLKTTAAQYLAGDYVLTNQMSMVRPPTEQPEPATAADTAA